MPPQGNQRDRLRSHDLELDELRQRTFRAQPRPAQGGTPRFDRLAWTKKWADESYPTSGDILPIRFVTSGGSHTSFLHRSANATAEVKILSEQWLPEGTLILVTECDGQWWSDSALHLADEIEGYLDEDLAVTDGSSDGIPDMYSDGLDPVAALGLDPGDPLTITNPPSGVRPGEFVFAGPEGARFRARRFGTTYRYTWVECEAEE